MTSDIPSSFTPPPSKQLRRSSSNRVVGGVSGGLGEYFGIDPVLFRIIFATTAFFGGGGIIAYLVAWLAIPEQGSTKTGLDRVVAELRRRRVPVWVAALALGIAAWIGLFSWWAPWGFGPFLVAAAILFVAFRRRGPLGPKISLTKTSPTETPGTAGPDATGGMTGTTGTVAAEEGTRVSDAVAWFNESRAASRLRRHRAAPIRWATLGVLVATLVGLVVADAANGVVIPAYFWVSGGIVLGGLLVGLVLRRTPWSVLLFLPVVVVGLIAFGHTRASFSDGTGEKTWTPTSYTELASQYRLALGKTTLDLTRLPASDTPRHVDITMGAGQAEIVLANAGNVRVNANVHIGQVDFPSDTAADNRDDRDDQDNRRDNGGLNYSRTFLPAATATGELVTIDVHLADGNITVRTA